MKKWLMVLMVLYFDVAQAQNYTFSKSTGIYSDLNGSIAIENGGWWSLKKALKMPFPIQYWGVGYTDSLYIDDYGSISINSDYNGEMSFLSENLEGRGIGKSPVSYIVSGTAPNRIFKLEFKNVGFSQDQLNEDSANLQCWIYETTNVIEYRYGPARVQPSSWSSGLMVWMFEELTGKFIILEGNPANPFINTSDRQNINPLFGIPSNGTIYRFTPTNSSGISKMEVGINVNGNKIFMMRSVEVKSVKIFNMSGQLVQSAFSTEDIELAILSHGLYLVMIETEEGVISHKFIH